MVFRDGGMLPVRVSVITDSDYVDLSRSGNEFGDEDLSVQFSSVSNGMSMLLSAPSCGVNQIVCRWEVDCIDHVRILNDHWERGYGDLAWQGYSTQRMLPWYFMTNNRKTTTGVGVMVQPNAFCFWELTPQELILVCDVRNGVRPVKLGRRQLDVCTYVTKDYDGMPPFQATCEFCKLLSPNSLTPKEPVYGFNDWYYIYGKNSATTVRSDAETLQSLTEELPNRPYCVIDAGWQIVEGGASGGPLDYANREFGDMKALADEIKGIGVRPGIWMRPLMTAESLPDGLKCAKDLLDPSHPQALHYIGDSLRHLVDDWGFELVKHDFSTFDVFGKWGFEMLGCITSPQTLTFQDHSKTTAEIILDLYRVIRMSAGNAVVIGCNVVGHLAAGLVEVQRTGDDTSGKEWGRTLKMGVNTLAFRSPQHGSFFAADADCVGLTNNVPWNLNRQWLDILAKSGTPLFVSADPEALGKEQHEALSEAFAIASVARPVAEPLDWMWNSLPEKWKIDGETVSYDWHRGAPIVLGMPSKDHLFV